MGIYKHTAIHIYNSRKGLELQVEKENFRDQKENIKTKKERTELFSPKGRLTAFAAGLCCGLLGTGGGTVLILFLSEMIGKNGEEKKRLFATCAAVILSVSVFCYGMYLSFGRVGWGIDWRGIVGALLGGISGAFLLKKMPAKLLGRIFSALLIVGGGLMLYRSAGGKG